MLHSDVLTRCPQFDIKMFSRYTPDDDQDAIAKNIVSIQHGLMTRVTLADNGVYLHFFSPKIVGTMQRHW